MMEPQQPEPIDNDNPVRLSSVDYKQYGIKVFPTACYIPEGAPPDVVLSLGQDFKLMGKGWKWWAADTYRWLEENVGDGAGMQLFDDSDYADGTIHNIVSIGGKVPVANRKPDLPFSHYEPISTLPPEEQSYWVERARADPDEGRPMMSRDNLREEIAEERNRRWAEENNKVLPSGAAAPEDGTAEAIYGECKRCKHCQECHGTQRVRIA